MLTSEETKQLVQVFSEVFATKEDISVLEEKMEENASSILTAVDAYSKKADKFFQELLVLAHRVDRHEKWIHQIAEKLGVKLEY